MSEMELAAEQIDRVVDIALAEDTAYGDVTSELLIPPDLQGRAEIVVKESGIFAGGEVARRVFCKVDRQLKVELLIEDGAEVKPGDVAATISGSVRSILTAERTALNFLQRLSGIATRTSRYVAIAARYGVDIADTRKTTPGLRFLEKYAVRTGGGRNHRLHLGDAVLIKDNHLAALRALGMGLGDIVSKAKQDVPPGLKVEVEVRTVAEAVEATEAGADIVMLDNMSPDDMRRAVELISGRVEIEASGGVNRDNLEEVAKTGIDFISVGALTHSVESLDISLEVAPQTLGLL